MEIPPEAITNDSDSKTPRFVLIVDSPSFVISVTLQSTIILTPASSHSSCSILTISFAEELQNNCPSFFSWYLILCFSTSEMKTLGVYLAKADLQKCGFSEIKLSDVVLIFVKLHLPPPEIKIFLPIFSADSITKTLRPRLPASIAHISPAAPAPMIITSDDFKCEVYLYLVLNR